LIQALDGGHAVDDLTVLEAKRFGIISCTAGSTLGQAIQRMVEEDISGLVVVDAEGYLAGIITRTDLLRAYQQSPDWKNCTVADFMKTEVVTVTPNDTVSRVIQLLVEHQIHRLVIVQREGQKLRPVGVISDADLVYHMSKV
jgi:CBS domain-containing protein